MNLKLWYLIFVLLVMPVMYYVCFHYGWGNTVHSWGWVIGCHLGAAAFAGIHGFTKQRHRWTRVVMTAIYLLMIFSLSCFAIIFGWGMHPLNWWLICIPYAFAATLPPFDETSRHLMFWKPEPQPKPEEHVYIAWLTAGCVEALNLIQAYYDHGATIEDFNAAETFIREQLEAIGNPVVRRKVETDAATALEESHHVEGM